MVILSMGHIQKKFSWVGLPNKRHGSNGCLLRAAARFKEGSQRSPITTEVRLVNSNYCWLMTEKQTTITTSEADNFNWPSTYPWGYLTCIANIVFSILPTFEAPLSTFFGETHQTAVIQYQNDGH